MARVRHAVYRVARASSAVKLAWDYFCAKPAEFSTPLDFSCFARRIARFLLPARIQLELRILLMS